MTKNTIEKAVRELNDELDEVNERRSQLRDSISQMQEMCEHTEHDYKYEGHTSHKNVYKCKYCGSETWD